MTVFLSTATPRGIELVAKLRAAGTREKMKELMERMKADFVNELAGGPAYTPADRFAFFLAAAERTTELPRASAAAYDAAGQTAMMARAYPEALLAFESAEQLHPCPERQLRMKSLRQLLSGSSRPLESAPPPRRPMKKTPG